ncbi:M48 family metallopeptidase [Pokkaliibacter sp. CJK22405]|uniref:M48 family metallopeptidase n=1 Tax=Pokkaliibacter sp. CJK22405 TaxID=3384615 RepID=UPI00398515A9
MTCFEGYVTEPGVSTRHPAALHCDEGGLRLESEPVALDFPWRDAVLAQPLGQLPRAMTLPNGWVFLPRDAIAFNAMLHDREGASWIDRLESSWKWILLALVLTLFSGVGIYRYGIPALASVVAPMIPDAVVEQVGQSHLAILDKAGIVQPTTLPQADQDRLQADFTRQLQTLEREGKHFSLPPQLVFRHLKDGPNAFALPGNTLVMTDELVALLKKDDQVMAVLLHELGHAYHQHVMKQLVQSTVMSVAFAMLVGDASGIGDTLSGGALFIMSMGYSRDAEREADAFAAQALRDEGVGVEPMIQAFIALENYMAKEHPELSDTPDWISSHPAMKARIEQLRQADAVTP